ncbi:MAG: N-succinylarginine dihydrolase [Pirellulaceae bacterium]|nr:N-succinylarginine dihydrolase [Pirellulaceae bacterium]
MKLVEAQIDRVVGPTHHYGGLGVGNVASMQNEGSISNPRAAALQGLEKMRLVAQLGVPQFILPPQPRPDLRFLRQIGYEGPREEVLPRLADENPRLLSVAMSCSAMWTANAATVSAAVDGEHEQAYMTVANLSSSLHRAIEPSQTLADLWQTFPQHVRMLDPLPGGAMMRDEGAANHMRLGSDECKPGIHIFVYGDQDPLPKSFWPRQTRAACEAIARRHRLPVENTFFIKQHPDAIDAGAFHNDVVAASHRHVLLHHELAFYEAESTLDQVQLRYAQLYDQELIRIAVPSSELSIQDTVATYLFNSQIVGPSDGPSPVILCPAQVNEHSDAKRIVDRWCNQDKLFRSAHFLDLRQSMAGGGGPACLRLRVPLTEDVIDVVPEYRRFSDENYQNLKAAIEQFYPESLSFADLSNPAFVEQTSHAAEEITQRLSYRSE